jgi:hypothetical protein
LPLKLIPQFSNPTAVESSPALDVVLNSITESSLLDTDQKVAKISGSSKTHGVPHGEKKDFSESLDQQLLVPESAVSNSKLLTPLLEIETNTMLTYFISIMLYYIKQIFVYIHFLVILSSPLILVFYLNSY